MQNTPQAATANKRATTLNGWLAARPLLTELVITALTVLLGMQTLRVLVPGLFWVLGGQMGWGAVQLGIVGFLVFLTAFLAGPLRKLSGDRYLIVATAGGVGLLRLCMQVWWEEPLFNLALAMAGTALFIIFLPTCLDNARLRGGPAISRFALGLLVGLALDTAINGAFNTYDISWQISLLPILLTVLLIAIQWILLAGMLRTSKASLTAPPTTEAGGISMPRSLTWLAIGPFLFLQLVVFQNIPLVATLTSWSLPIAFGWTLLAQLMGLAAATWLLLKMQRNLWLWALASGIGLVAVLALSHQGAAVSTAVLLLIGQVLLSMLIVLVLIGIAASSEKTGRSGIALANGLGMVLLLVFLLAYYAVYDISLPYTNTMLEPIAAFIIAICALGTPVAARREIKVDPKALAVPVVALLLLILPLASAISWQSPAAAPDKGFPIRVMDYNLHNGFNIKGHLDMEAIAQVIEDSDADIVALQEVSRGWVVNGRIDMLTWLSQRLDMSYVFGPTTGPLWGNAILSRYPIVGYTQHDLPPRDLPLLRGFTSATIDMGNGTQLQVIATHFHHPATVARKGDADIRLLQSAAIIDFWNNASFTVLLGDLNGEPHDPEIKMLQQAGLVDAAAVVGGTPACTSPSDNPQKRIDYIWVSPDLKVNDVQVPVTTASDHLPVVAVIDR